MIVIYIYITIITYNVLYNSNYISNNNHIKYVAVPKKKRSKQKNKIRTLAKIKSIFFKKTFLKTKKINILI